MKTNNKGITLIALVITIIVLLILAGVSIAMLTGSNGVLTKATQAQVDNARGEASDKINTALNGVYTILLSNDYTDISGTSKNSVPTASSVILGNGLDKNEYIVETSNENSSETDTVVKIVWVPGGAKTATGEPEQENVAERYKGYIEGSITIDKTASTGDGRYKINSASINQNHGKESPKLTAGVVGTEAKPDAPVATSTPGE